MAHRSANLTETMKQPIQASASRRVDIAQYDHGD
jgi:hypothetical protein